MKNMVLLLVLLTGLSHSQTARSEESFSHAKWQSVLTTYVDHQGMVDYQGLSNNRETFDQYLATIQSMGPESTPELFHSRNDELAFYINAYNALVFNGVLDRGPEDKTVWSGLISGYLFFEWMSIRVDGKKTSLKKLEDDVIRAGFNDPRIHAAINCASISCPRLPRMAYLAETLDRQLDESMWEFVNTESNVLLKAQVVYLSSIFDWFAQDFISYEENFQQDKSEGLDLQAINPVLGYINQFRAEGRKIPVGMEVKFFPYNKDINKQ